MILCDKDIRERCINKQKPLIVPFEENNLGAVSYDLSIDEMILGDVQKDSYELHPNSFIMVKMEQKLYMDRDIIGRIEEKNSIMRMGIVVSGPVYQPEHETAIFLRVHNISNNIIVLKKGMRIAQIMFEKITDNLERSYAERNSVSFQREFDYRKYGNYMDNYEQQVKR